MMIWIELRPKSVERCFRRRGGEAQRVAEGDFVGKLETYADLPRTEHLSTQRWLFVWRRKCFGRLGNPVEDLVFGERVVLGGAGGDAGGGAPGGGGALAAAVGVVADSVEAFDVIGGHFPDFTLSAFFVDVLATLDAAIDRDEAAFGEVVRHIVHGLTPDFDVEKVGGWFVRIGWLAAFIHGDGEGGVVFARGGGAHLGVSRESTDENDTVKHGFVYFREMIRWRMTSSLMRMSRFSSAGTWGAASKFMRM